MQNIFNKILMLLVLLLAACGGGRKLAKNPQVIGLVPPLSADNIGNPEQINAWMFESFKNSGSLFPQPLDTLPGFWSLQKFQQVNDSLLEWMVSIKIDYEKDGFEKGTKIPFVVFKPQSIFEVHLTYRLFQKGAVQYSDIGELTSIEKQAGDYQMLEYDSSDPSLSLSGKERFFLRRAAYKKAAQLLITKIAKKMKVK